jgi:hypothetical protein
VEDGETIQVIIKDLADNISVATTTVVDAIPPATEPTPSDGGSMTGKGEKAGDTVVVVDKDGVERCTTVVDDNLVWTCTLDPAATEGDKMDVVEIDEALNEIIRPWRIGIPRLTVAKKSLLAGDKQSVTGENFQPGELVKAVMRSDPLAVGEAEADDEGQVTFSWTIPAGAALGAHEVELSGPLSGSVTTPFEVVAPEPLPFTGAGGVMGLGGAAVGLFGAGWLLLFAARRRRREEA